MNYDNVMEVTKCLSACTLCTGLYTSDVLNAKIICNCDCHEKKHDDAIGFREPDSASSSQYILEIAKANDQ